MYRDCKSCFLANAELCCNKTFCHFIPVYYISECSQVIRAFVLVFQVMLMFPNQHPEQNYLLHFGYIRHQGIVLVRGEVISSLPSLG